ncbi:MAG TPA: undecaprenyl-diphosphate phosphatase [Acidothermaceae bacterium]|nr:undecaprenyl-diphosphate phosphatase [Acidothermaceae bacterium]
MPIPTDNPHITFFQAITIGVMQGVTELFPVSSLGHSVLVPALIGGSWKTLVSQEHAKESPYLAFIVGLHVATALALLLFFWRDWVRLIRGFLASLPRLARRLLRQPVEGPALQTVHEKMAWLIIVATIPAGVIGLALEHVFRTLFAKPLAAAIFLTINAGILFAGEKLRRVSKERAASGLAASGSVAAVDVRGDDTDDPAYDAVSDPEHDPANDVEITRRFTFRDAVVVGVFQSLALLAGISRSGITMVAGLIRGLDHEQAVRFGFLLATPVIFAAGVIKIPDLVGPLGDGIRGQVLAGSAAAFIAAIVTIKFLVRWFRTRTLTPFAWYCGIFGVVCIVRFA